LTAEAGRIVVDGSIIKPQKKGHLGHRIITLLSAPHEAATENTYNAEGSLANFPELPES
jgi:hypothetical protein